jgi:hypothetical protein
MLESLCCETKLREASVDLEVFSLHLQQLRAAGLLDGEKYAECFKHLALIQREVGDALDCAADELAQWFHLSRAVAP